MRYLIALLSALLMLSSASVEAQSGFNGAKALEYARQFVAIGPRWPTSPGHVKAEEFLRAQFKNDKLEEDTFTANTPIGYVPMRNFIVRFPGRKDGVIVLATHYETNYPLKNIKFVGANDGGSTTGLLMELANHLRGHILDGPSVWLVFFDGEEAFQDWYSMGGMDNTYGSRHLAAKWGAEGSLKKIKAFILTDMIGAKELDVQKETRDTGWLVNLVTEAAKKSHNESHFFRKEMQVEDDHLPFVQRGVPSIDLVDINYGPNQSFHHTEKDTMDKLSAKSLTIDGDVLLETIRLLSSK